jgi:prevent-host-death family protein
LVQEAHMRVSVSQAKGQLLELVRRAEDGEDIELTRRGQAVARLVAVRRRDLSREDRRRILLKAMEDGRARAGTGESAATSADFLYDDETGLPG